METIKNALEWSAAMYIVGFIGWLLHGDYRYTRKEILHTPLTVHLIMFTIVFVIALILFVFFE